MSARRLLEAPFAYGACGRTVVLVLVVVAAAVCVCVCVRALGRVG